MSEYSFEEKLLVLTPEAAKQLVADFQNPVKVRFSERDHKLEEKKGIVLLQKAWAAKHS
ncbi:hypothetical protein [Arsukibacterium sp.]|uniref:hypothetical protein n=1 Tax=Arsukibacterium sp. TaxID=1977258 RepID=UPI00299E86CC|nr:hypothetical protein [Arsukibacterium sp.]MDX1539594.1 hypothetical protein [Arsukibacterium sp.]